MSLFRILPLLVLLLGLGWAPPTPAQQARPVSGLTAEDIDRLTSLLQDEARRAEFLRTLEALSAASRAQSGAVGEGTAPQPAAPPAAEGAEAAPPPAARPRQPAPPADAGAEAAPPARAATPAAPSPPAAPAAAAPAGAAPAAAPPAAAPPAAAPAAPPAAAPAAADLLIAPNTLGAQLLVGLSSRLAGLSDSLLQAARSVADLPALLRAVGGLAQDPVARTRLLDAAWKLALLLGLGLLAEAAISRAVRRPRARLEALAPAVNARWQWFRRLPLLLGRLLLELLPIAGFALAVYGLFGLVHPLPTTQLVGLLLAHTYMAARAAFALARLLFSPSADHLRLIPCSNALAAAAVRWLRRLMLVGVGGYALAEAGLLFGLPWSAYDAILNLTLLLISLMLVRIVLQQQDAVAGLLRTSPLEEGEEATGTRLALRGLRNQLAEVWHILVILWLVASWMVWALAVEDGPRRLLTGTLLTLVTIGLAKALDEGSARLLDKLLNPSAELAKRWPGLPARAATYVPLVKVVVSTLLGAGAFVLVLETWGLDSLDWFASGTLGHRLVMTLFSIGCTLVLALVVWEAANGSIQRRLVRLARDSHAARSARVRTLLPMLRTVIGVFILVFVLLNALSELGVNVAPLLAGAGVVGLAIGFGSQTLVRDIITGVFLLLEDAVAVGDVVQLGGLSGVVEHLSIRSIKLRATDGSVHIIPFSAVTTVTNMTRDFAFAVLDITVAYAEDTDAVADALREIGKEVRAEAKWHALIKDDIDVFGVEKLADSGVMIRARVKTEPAARWSVGREFNRRIKQRFEERGIMIPRPQPMVMVERAPAPPPPPPETEAAAQRAAE